jgi:hypothetical protein
VASTPVLKINQMVKDRCYPIVFAERVTTHLGQTVQLVIEDSGAHFLIYLPKRYARVVSDEDMEQINSDQIWWTIVYKGFCLSRHLALLEVV